MKKMIALAALLGAFLMTGCNTVQGVGEDVTKAGHEISGAAEGTGGTGTY